MAELPTGTVTFLFTDLEGSTRLWREHPEVMQEALARHDKILRTYVEARGGQVVKTTGDGLHAVFGAARGAVGAAGDAQRALSAEVWPLPERLRVRMGVHSGEAEIRDDDYYGTAVNRAARVSAAAQGGQVLVSAATVELVRDALPEELSLVDLGEHRLRDLGSAEHLFQLGGKGLDSEFPPVRSLEAFPTNLRSQVTTFLGRSEDIAALRELVGGARLLTLVGVGGVGKTRLALQLAAEVLPYRRDGAWLVELAAVSDPEVVPEVVGAGLRVRQREGQTMAASIVDYLRAKDLLVVLDNCEHVVGAASELVRDVLEECPGVTIVATSREGLGVHGEQLWPVASLETPKAETDVAHAAGVAAVRLFVDRARLVRPDFSLGDENVAAVVELCRRLDGIPLALELAAARVRSLSPAQIAERLDERFRLLTGGKRSAVERHQTLRSTVDWSYELLDEAARRVFDRLGVFAGGFTLDAAEAVAADAEVDAIEVVDLLDELVSKSMVVAEDVAGDVRYRLLETLRQYARERLDERGDADSVRRRHAEFFAGSIAEMSQLLWGPDQVRWSRRLLAELENLRAAVTWSIDAGDPALAVALLEPLLVAAMNHGEWGLDALAGAVCDAPGAPDQPGFPEVCAIRAFGANQRGEYEDARTVGDLALATLGARGEPDRYWPVYTRMTIAASSGTAEEILAYVERANAAPDRDELAEVLGSFTEAMLAGDFGGISIDDAVRQVEVGLDQAHDLGNPSVIAFGHYALARLLEPVDPIRARPHLEAAAQGLAEQGLGDPRWLAESRLARLEALEARPREAMAALRTSLTGWRDVGARNAIVLALVLAVPGFEALREPRTAAFVCGIIEGEVIARYHPRGADRDRYDTARAAVREELGDEHFDTLAEQGTHLAYDEALDWILTEAERIGGVHAG
jgi:predicted ATPase/class 3 adenylate cyclase